MSISFLSSVFGYMVVSSYTPGPGNLLALNTTTTYGWKKGKTLIKGLCCGYCCVLLLCLFSVSKISAHLPAVLTFLRYAGTLYILYLALCILRSRPVEESDVPAPAFRKGVLLQLFNAKLYFYLLTLLSTYLSSFLDTFVHCLITGICVLIVGCSASVTWALCGVKLQRLHRKRYREINVLFCLFLLYCVWNTLNTG